MHKPSVLRYILGVGLDQLQEWRDRCKFDVWRVAHSLDEGKIIVWHCAAFDKMDTSVFTALDELGCKWQKKKSRLLCTSNFHIIYEALINPEALRRRFENTMDKQEVIADFLEAAKILREQATPKLRAIINQVVARRDDGYVTTSAIYEEMGKVAIENNQFIPISFYHQFGTLADDFPSHVAIFSDEKLIGTGLVTLIGKDRDAEGCAYGKVSIKIGDQKGGVPYFSPYFTGWALALGREIEPVVRQMLGERDYLFYRATS